MFSKPNGTIYKNINKTIVNQQANKQKLFVPRDISTISKRLAKCGL